MKHKSWISNQCCANIFIQTCLKTLMFFKIWRKNLKVQKWSSKNYVTPPKIQWKQLQMMGFMMLKKSYSYFFWLWKYLHLKFAEVTKNHLVWLFENCVGFYFNRCKFTTRLYKILDDFIKRGLNFDFLPWCDTFIWHVSTPGCVVMHFGFLNSVEFQKYERFEKIHYWSIIGQLLANNG